MHDLARRDHAVRATLARWRGAPLDWINADCARVASWHIRAMGHHLAFGWHKAGSYRTALGAQRALRRAGHASLSAALASAGVLRIGAASCLPGDLISSVGSEGHDAVGVVIGNGMFLGFHEDEPVCEPRRLVAAGDVQGWRL